MRPAFAVLLLLLLAPASALAQEAGIRGRFQDVTTRTPVPAVSVRLTAYSDTTVVHRVTAKDDGSFVLAGLAVRSYRLEATRLGYAPLRQIVRVTRKDQDLGVLGLTPESVPVSGIEVTESPAPAIQKGDTTEYNAGAVKVEKSATAEDLVQKLPGVTMENGQIRAQGQNVQQVLVNGRPFFGSDPTAAMRNLPAEVVDRIQVYDRPGDLAEFSGFDDGGSSQRTMNFILRDQRANFGRAYAGYGDQDRYQAGGNATVVRGGTRLTAIGMSNNINQRNFSPQDLFGGAGGGGGGPRMMMFGGPRSGGGGGQVIRMGGNFGGGGAFDPSSFLVGQQNGVATTHSGGLNYVGQWSRKLQVSASAFVTGSDNENTQLLDREYVPPQDSLLYYQQAGRTETQGGNQRFDARLEWNPDSSNAVIFQPRLYFQQSDGRTAGQGVNLALDGAPLSSGVSLSRDDLQATNLSGRLTLRHRFARRGRNISAEFNAGQNGREGEGAQQSLTEYYQSGGTTGDTLDQQSTTDAVTNSYSARVAFTTPLTGSLQGQILYAPSLTRSRSDAEAFRPDPVSGAYVVPDSLLTNSHESRSLAQSAGLATLYTRGTWRLLTSASYQRSELRSEQTFPYADVIDRTFEDVLPAVTLNGTFSNRRSLRVAWNTSTTAPTIAQLQDVVNNSNPLALSTGNPDLRPTYNHSLSLRFSKADPVTSRSRFLFANLTRTSHAIGNSTFTALSDTTVDGVFLARGTQLTRPENLGTSYNGNLFAVVSRPMGFLKSILNLNGGGTFSRTPTRIGGQLNTTDTWATRAGVVLASNISANLDFTVSYWGTYNFSRSTLTTGRSGDYYTHNAALRLNTVMGPGIVMRQEVSHNLQNGSSDYRDDVMLWNLTLGKKFMKDRAEFRVTATDALAQNRSSNRSITESYVQDTRDRTLGRYLQAVLQYSWAPPRDPGPPRMPMMH